MKFFHTLKQDLNKTVVNLGFLGAALMTCVLCFTASAYHDLSNDKSYSIFEAFFSFDRKFIESNDSFASYRLFGNGMTGYISMFLPIIVAFPFMVSFCAERNNGLMRFTISRAGKLRYYLSKFSASFLGGGLAVLLGMALFGAIVRITFPTLESYKLDPEMLQWTVPDGEAVGVVKILSSSFIYGAFSTLPAFFLSSFCKNPYIITCLPFMLIYVWNTAINKLTMKAFETGDMVAYEKLAPFQPNSSSQIIHIKFSEMTPTDRTTLIFNGAYLAAMLAGFIVIMDLRTDQGN
ncbi:MAG: hypothetical protein IJ746_04175 [Ruminococcus sp.]|nr:hypothetical protein [Ruminococcus sp.]